MPKTCYIHIGRLLLASLYLLTLMSGSSVQGQKVPTPVATEFNIEVDELEQLVFGWTLPLTGTSDLTRVGLAAVCDRPKGTITVIVQFGFFPPDKPVQLAVRMADGTGWFHGQKLIGGPGSGFHSPVIRDRAEAVIFLQHALARGSLISNGHNSFWNRLPDEENRRALKALQTCKAS